MKPSFQARQFSRKVRALSVAAPMYDPLSGHLILISGRPQPLPATGAVPAGGGEFTL